MAKTATRRHASPRKGTRSRRASSPRTRKSQSRPKTARVNTNADVRARGPEILEEESLAQARVREDESEDEEGAYGPGQGETD